MELPSKLEDALDALVADDVLVGALGEEWVEWYTAIKRKGEVDQLQGDCLEMEQQMYSKFC